MFSEADQRSDKSHELHVVRWEHETNFETLEAILENVTEGIVIANPEGELLAINTEALRQHGFSNINEASWFVSRYEEVFEVRTLKGDKMPRESLPLFRVLRGERFTDLEVEVRRLDTGAAWFASYSGRPIYKKGAIHLVLLTTHDITQQKEAETVLRDREEQFRLFVESAPHGIVVVGPDGEIALVNAQVEQAFCYGPGELVGKPVEILVPERFRGHHAALRGAFMARPEARPMGAGRDLFGLRKDGSEFPVEIGLAPVWIHNKTMVLASIVDITERKRAEDTVRFLAEASFVLAGSLDYETTLDSVANLVVPEYADWCGIDLLDENGVLQQVTVAHVDPSKVEWARELRRRYPPNMESTTGAPQVIRTGRSEILLEIPDEVLRLVAIDEEHYRILKDVGIHSAIIAPLMARGRTLGVLSLVLAESGRRYREEDLPIIEELARMCALAVDNARLYHEAQQEIAERRRVQEILRESEQRYRLLFEITSDWAFLYTRHADGIFHASWISEAFERITGWSAEEVATREQWARFIYPDDFPIVKAFMEQMQEGQSRVMEHRFFHKDGSLGWLRIYGQPLWDEATQQVGQILGAGQDITAQKSAEEEAAHLFQTVQNELAERKRAEQQLKELNETLEQRVVERTAALEQRNRDLQSFAFVASHDLKEPLRKIRMFAGLLRNEAGNTLNENARFYLERMEHAATRMSDLLSDVLAFSRVETLAEPFEQVNIKMVVADVLSDLELTVEETEAVIELDAEASIEADPNQVRQLLNHLLQNALKFRQSEVKPHIRITASIEETSSPAGSAMKPETQEKCLLVVEDNGMGFEEKYAERIFAPLQRLHGRDEYPGTGMGLAICRRIVERHGGTIRAESTPGDGSRFIVELPARQNNGQ